MIRTVYTTALPYGQPLVSRARRRSLSSIVSGLVIEFLFSLPVALMAAIMLGAAINERMGGAL